MKHFTFCLIGATLCTLFVAIPLDTFIHSDNLGKRMTMPQVAREPDAEWTETMNIFKDEWWRDDAKVWEVRNRFADQTDEEFLNPLNKDSEGYRRIKEVLDNKK